MVWYILGGLIGAVILYNLAAFARGWIWLRSLGLDQIQRDVYIDVMLNLRRHGARMNNRRLQKAIAEAVRHCSERSLALAHSYGIDEIRHSLHRNLQMQGIEDPVLLGIIFPEGQADSPSHR